MKLQYTQDRLTLRHVSMIKHIEFVMDDFGNLQSVDWNIYIGCGTEDFYLSEQELGTPCISCQLPH